MNTHTPGPWFISYTHDGNTEIAIDDAPGMDGERDYDLVTVTHGDPDELRANARLIAAAPELLAALELAVESLHKAFDYVPAGHENAACRGNLVPTLQNARLIIAKATAA